MKKMVVKMTVAVCVSCFLFSCASNSGLEAAGQDKEKNAEALLMEQSLLGTLWIQQSGEYRALAYQAFNTAKIAFDSATVSEGMKKAVAVDLDETMIDNSAEGAGRICAHKGFNKEGWTKWCQAEKALAVPGAVDFANYVNKNGGKVFYVSNRKVGAEYQPTVNNLKELGFPCVDETTVLLKDKSSNKTSRFEQVKKDGYEIVVFVGDNLDDFDFTNETYHKVNDARRSAVDNHKAQFGTKYIVMPNPMYGNWEGGLINGYFKNDSQTKVKIRKKRLRAWK